MPAPVALLFGFALAFLPSGLDAADRILQCLLLSRSRSFGGDLGRQRGAAVRKARTRCRARAHSQQCAHAPSDLGGESAVAESAGPAVVSARLAGGDVVAIAGSVNILTYYFVTLPTIKRAEDLKGKIGANQSPGTIADFALRVSLRKLGLDPAKDVSLRSIGVLYDRIAAMQKGIVQFTVVTEAGEAGRRQAGVSGFARSDSRSRFLFLNGASTRPARRSKSSRIWCGATCEPMWRQFTISRRAKRKPCRSCANIRAWKIAACSGTHAVVVHGKHAGLSLSAYGRISSRGTGNGVDPTQSSGAQRERVSRRSLRQRIGRRRIRRQSRQKVTGVRSQSFLAKVFIVSAVIPAEAGIQNGRMPHAPTRISGFPVARGIRREHVRAHSPLFHRAPRNIFRCQAAGPWIALQAVTGFTVYQASPRGESRPAWY